MISVADYNCFLQNNSRYNESEAWPEEQFPDAQYRYFREAGCLVCALAFLLRYQEIEAETNTDVFNPWTFCERLIQHHAFSAAADLEIAAVSRLYPVSYLGSISYSRENLEDSVDRGYACLITVKGNHGPFHFVALEEVTKDDALVFDPSAGRRYLSEYAKIYQIRLFHRTDHKKANAKSGVNTPRDRSDGIIPGKIAIGFDDGPTERYTEQILNILAANDVKASFFVLGESIRKHESSVRRMVRDGHQVGIHGWNHLYLNAMEEEECRNSLERTASEIRRVCEVNPTVLRPPGGYIDNSVIKVAESMGLAIIGWSVDAGDWMHGRTVDEIAEAVLSQVSAGDIILMHDIGSVTLEALEIIIPELKRRDFSLVTQDELAVEGAALKPGKIYNWIG